MRVKKVFNNNAALVESDDGSEFVVTGKGVAFQRKPGDAVDEARVEKEFHLSSREASERFEQILSSIPVEEIELASRIVDVARMSVGHRIQDSIIVSLSDHMHFALLNHVRGIRVQNNLLAEIKRFYPDEFAIGMRALEIIRDERGVELSEDEAGFIALHVVNAETQNAADTNQVEQSTRIINEIVAIVHDFFERDLDEDSLAYFRFITHLKYLAMRICSGETFGDDEQNDALLAMMSKTYREPYLCALNVRNFVKGRYEVDMGNEELLYLVIHIQRAVSSINGAA